MTDAILNPEPSAAGPGRHDWQREAGMPSSTSLEMRTTEPGEGAERERHDTDPGNTPGLRDQKLLDLLNHSEGRDPEVRKLLTRIYEARVEAGRVVDCRDLSECAVRRFRDLAATSLEGISLDGALELVEEWDRWLVENADATYVFSALEAEYLRASKDEHGTSVTWKAVYPGEAALSASMRFRSGREITAEDEKMGRNRLAGLYRARATAYGLERARARVRDRNLWMLTVIMIIVGLVLALTLVLVYPGRPLFEIALAPAAAALGASLSGARQLQKSVPRINAERYFLTVMVSQIAVGSAVGLALLLMLDSGFVPLDIRASPIAVTGTVAFLGGFAEPFFLRIVERLTSGAE